MTFSYFVLHKNAQEAVFSREIKLQGIDTYVATYFDILMNVNNQFARINIRSREIKNSVVHTYTFESSLEIQKNAKLISCRNDEKNIALNARKL